MDRQGLQVYVFMKEHQQYELLKLLAKEISKNYEFGSRFQEESWRIVGNHMQRMNPQISFYHLKAKLRILKTKYWLFSTLLARQGVQWDRRTNSMAYDSPGVWMSYSLEYPKGNQFHYEGIKPRLFDAMRDVFEAGVAIDD